MRAPGEGLGAGRAGGGRLTRVGDRVAWYASAVGVERWARVGALLAIPLLPPEDGLGVIAPLFAALAVYVLATMFLRRGPVLRSIDLLVAALVIVIAGPNVLPFVPFLIVSVAGPGARRGPWWGLGTGGLLGLVLLVQIAGAGASPVLGLGGSLSIALLLPLAGLTAAAAAQVLEDRSVRDRLVLQQANRLLSSLQAIADEIPGGLDLATVSAAILAEVRSVAGVDQAVVYVEHHGALQPSASAGTTREHLRALDGDTFRGVARTGRVVDRDELPGLLGLTSVDPDVWVVLPLERSERPVGAVLCGCRSSEVAEVVRSRLATLGEDASLALENAQLFDGTRERAADTARRQVAGDLHDGVAQSLAHLRMELELLARADGEEVGDEAARLARVAGSALEDLRATISVLRKPRDGDLLTQLRSHVEQLRTPHGPTIELQARAPVALEAARAEQALRFAQEALSNALQHADAGAIVVRLSHANGAVRLEVADDGVGLRQTPPVDGPEGPERALRGVGLRSMQERADELGGRLALLAGDGGGTVVRLEFPLTPAPGGTRQAEPATRPALR